MLWDMEHIGTIVSRLAAKLIAAHELNKKRQRQTGESVAAGGVRSRRGIVCAGPPSEKAGKENGLTPKPPLGVDLGAAVGSGSRI
jgi:hypothetical protein